MNPYEKSTPIGTIRERLGRPHIENIDTEVQTVESFIAEILLKPYLTNLKSDLQTAFFKLTDAPELPRTAAGVSLIYVGRLSNYLKSYGVGMIELEDKDARILAAEILDIVNGMQIIVGTLHKVHVFPSINSPEDWERAYDKERKRGAPWSLSQFMSLKEPHEQMARLLKEDPSGYSLIDWQIEKLRRAPSEPIRLIKPCEIPEFVIAGAELARDLYQGIYPRLPALIPNLAG